MTKEFDVAKIRQDFPILSEEISGKPLVYLDNGASSQKPQAVISAISDYYQHSNANVHRGVHTLSDRATSLFESARKKVARFINANSEKECIFVRGTTEAINLVAMSFGQSTIKEGDEILISHLEHHSNIIPWQMLCQRTGAKLVVAPITKHGEIDIEAFKNLLSSKTKIVALNHVSNAIGTINPIKALIKLAKTVDATVIIDGAQAVPHQKVDVLDLGADFYAFSGHKMYAPTGIGVLWGKEALLEKMPPFQGGGEMIRYVTFEKSDYAEIPHKFEAGTPNIAGAVGLGAAIDYINSIGFEAISKHESALLAYATKTLEEVGYLKLIGQAKEKAAILSFVHNSVHPHDIGTILNAEGVAVRSGHHCAMPLMNFYQVAATTRASFCFYNTFAEVDRLFSALAKVNEVFA